MTRSLALGLVSAIALFSAANAADIYRAEGPGGYKDGPVYVANTWTGFYIGANAGYGWSNDDNHSYYYRDELSSLGLSPEGAFGGGQIGYNWQGGLGLGHNIVFGIEADFQGGDISDNRYGIESSLNWFGTVRGRLGYAFDRTLIYATGGFAYGEVENRVGNFKASDTQTGYVIGGGIEYKINPAWSLKAEYQYINLDASDSSTPALGFTGNDESEFHTVRIGVNYHLGQSTYDPLK